MAKMLLSRKRDLCYLLFFVVHIPVMLSMYFTISVRFVLFPLIMRESYRGLNSRAKSFNKWSLNLIILLSLLTSFVDLTPLYPQSVHAQFPFLAALRNWYISTYRDRFFTDPPAWFGLYTWMEAVYHLPTSMWAIRAILRDDRQLPLVLLVFAAQTALTTATCVAEMLSWKDRSIEEKKAFAGLYVPYLVLALLMLADMYGRLYRTLMGENMKKYKKV